MKSLSTTKDDDIQISECNYCGIVVFLVYRHSLNLIFLPTTVKSKIQQKCVIKYTVHDDGKRNPSKKTVNCQERIRPIKLYLKSITFLSLQGNKRCKIPIDV